MDFHCREHHVQSSCSDKRTNRYDTLTVTTSSPGVTRVEVYRLVAELEDRDDCFCCSCHDPIDDSDFPRADAYCRNHGFAGRRPCERHEMPGAKDHDYLKPGQSDELESVQKIQAGEELIKEFFSPYRGRSKN